VESGRVPLNVAITIAGASDEKSVQAALQDAYESGQLRGGQLMQTRRVLQRRNTLGKTLKHRPARKGAAITTSSLLPFPKETPQTVVEHLARRTLEVLAFVRADRHGEREHLRMELSPQAQ